MNFLFAQVQHSSYPYLGSHTVGPSPPNCKMFSVCGLRLQCAAALHLEQK